MTRSHLRFLSAALLILLIPNVGQGAKLGRRVFYSPPAVALDDPTHLMKGLSRASFICRVGGVAFGERAVAPADMKAIRIQYLPDRPDGQRLWVHMWDNAGSVTSVLAPVYDWQIIPIARFAASEQHACFTLFGELKDKEDAAARRKSGQRILNYHPAFADTLLGLRLMQADIQILDPDACDLPTEDGRYILGAGEGIPNQLANYHALHDMSDLLDVLDRKPGNGRFRSYVICDHGRPVSYSASSGRLVLTGDPIWYCWRARDNETWEVANRSANQAANVKANHLLNAEHRADAQLLGREELERKWTTEYQQQRFEELYRAAFDEEMTDEIVTMPTYSEQLSRDIRELRGINPAVYNAVVATMRYAAFLRDVKNRDPEGFSQFLRDVKGVELVPHVETPTVMDRPDEDISPPWLPRAFEQAWVTAAADPTPIQESGRTITTVARGRSFRVLDVQGPWYRVRVLNQDGAEYGWIFSQHAYYERKQFSYTRR